MGASVKRLEQFKKGRGHSSALRAFKEVIRFGGGNVQCPTHRDINKEGQVMAKGRANRSNTQDKADTATGKWNFYEFKQGGFSKKYDGPTARINKQGITLYNTEFKPDQHVSFASNGTKVAIVSDEDSSKTLKRAGKSSSAVVLGSARLVKDVKLNPGDVRKLEKGTVGKKQGYSFAI